MKYICEHCNSEFTDFPSNSPRFCSRTCYDKHREGNFVCLNCGKKFNGYKCRKRIFCSDKCTRLYNKGTKHYHWKGGRRIEADGYVTVFIENHPNYKSNCMPEHRLVMEKKLGRYLDMTEIVHHINGNKADNRVSNLVITTRAIHRDTHRGLNGRWSHKFEKCVKCGTTEIKHEVHGLCYECYKKSIRK